MINCIIRAVLIYFSVTLCVRFMGKRQIGELQPSELVITIILSEVAVIPLQDNEASLLATLLLIFLLASLEIISSQLSVSFPLFRRIFEGNSVLVIKNGKIIEDNIKMLRLGIQDLLEALRLKDVFDISDVDFAYIETNGNISVKLRSSCRPPTKKDDMKNDDGCLPCLVISDGKIIKRELELCNMSQEKLESVLKKRGVEKSRVLLMTADAKGNYNIIRKKDSR